MELKFAAAVFITYFAAMRTEEWVELETHNLQVSPMGNLQILVDKSKVNRFKQRRTVYLIAALEEQALCPCKVLVEYYNRLTATRVSHYVLSNLRGNCSIIQGSKLTYNNHRASWIKLFKSCDIPRTSYMSMDSTP